jgi:hypothetical protein
MQGDQRSFFTDEDPSIPNSDLFNTVERAEFRDSYTPDDKVQQRREADALEAFATLNTRPVRINYKAVATSIEIA